MKRLVMIAAGCACWLGADESWAQTYPALQDASGLRQPPPVTQPQPVQQAFGGGGTPTPLNPPPATQPRNPPNAGGTAVKPDDFTMPQQGSGGTAPQQPSQGGGDANDPLAQLAQYERQDMGVAPTDQLHAGPPHGPTPNSIPGGQLVTTQGVIDLQQRQIPHLLFDVLGAGQQIPNSILAVPASATGSFQDEVQQGLGQYLQNATGGNAEMPLVFYCQGIQCWMSYNAALRAINLGYRNVLWYRGGLEAWQAAGQQLVTAQR